MCAVKEFLLVWCLTVGLLTSWQVAQAQDVSTMLRKIRECIASDLAIICLKERALDALNETIVSDKPISIYGLVNIVKDPKYTINDTVESNLVPRDPTERSAKLNDMIYDKVEDFLSSRTIQIRLENIIEGRGKKDKNKGGMLMMGGLAMAGMMVQLFMGKIAFMAGAALLLAKLALMLSTVIGFKKLSGGGGGGESTQVIYSGTEGHSHGGGWYRSIAANDPENIENNPYRTHIPDNSLDNNYNNNYTY